MTDSPLESQEWTDQKNKLKARFAILTGGKLISPEEKKEELPDKITQKPLPPTTDAETKEDNLSDTVD